MTTWILAGRHQPPHNDHLAIVRSALQRVPGALVLGLIVQRPPAGAPETAFENEARLENDPARCPFTFLQRLVLVEAMLLSLPVEQQDRVRIVPLPRPEAEWPLVEAMFPGDRAWVVPDVGDAFDDSKAHWLRARGERVERVRIARKTTDGRTVRGLLDRPEALARHVPPLVAHLIRHWRSNSATERSLTP